MFLFLEHKSHESLEYSCASRILYFNGTQRHKDTEKFFLTTDVTDGHRCCASRILFNGTQRHKDTENFFNHGCNRWTQMLLQSLCLCVSVFS